MSTANEKPAATPRLTRRWRWLAGVSGAVLIAAGAYGAYWAQVLRYRQSTDDAYVSGNVVQITPQISGTVVAIGADDTQFVKAGQPLVRLDQADAKVALEPGRGAAGAQTCATCATCSPPARAAARRRCSCASADLQRRAERPGAPRAPRQQRARCPARSCSTPRDAVKAAQAALLAAAAAAGGQPCARRWHDARESPAGARRGRRGAQRLPRRCRAPSCRRRWRASSPRATCSSASASARARR